MEDDLFISAARATRLVENIQAYMAADPTSDDEWADMSQRLEAILGEFVRTLQENEQPVPDVPLLLPSSTNPYFF